MLYVGTNHVLLHFRFIPPSLNHMYTIARKQTSGGSSSPFKRKTTPYITLLSHARMFKELVTLQLNLARLALPEAWKYFNVKYLMLFEQSEVFIPPPKRKSKTPRKHDVVRMDVTNMFKLLEDAIYEYLETDDRYVFSVEGHKRTVPDSYFTKICEHSTDSDKFKNRRGITIVRIENLDESEIPVSDDLKDQFGFDIFDIKDGSECPI